MEQQKISILTKDGEQLKISILKKNGDFHYRVRKNNKWVTLARIFRGSTAKMSKRELDLHEWIMGKDRCSKMREFYEIDYKCDSLVNELNSVLKKWQRGYIIDVNYHKGLKTLTDQEIGPFDDYLEDQLIAIEEQFVQMHEKQKKQILQDFEQNFDRMLQHLKESIEDYKKTIAEQR